MDAVPETRALIDELCGPTLCSEDELRAWMKGTTALVKTFGQHLALLRGMAHEAEVEERTTEVRGKMEGVIQQIDAQARIIGNIAKESRSLRVSLLLLHEQVAELAKETGALDA